MTEQTRSNTDTEWLQAMREEAYNGRTRLDREVARAKLSEYSLLEAVITIDGDTHFDGQALQDYSGESGNTRVHFRNIRESLIAAILDSHPRGLILGAVAWLTDPEILDALAQRPCAMLVQKEDFLRPDADAQSGWVEDLQQKYNAIQDSRWERPHLPGELGWLSICGDPSIGTSGTYSYGGGVRLGSTGPRRYPEDQRHPVRCVGNHNAENQPAFPRMHNKFLVFCDPFVDNEEDEDSYRHVRPIPSSVWTGSFNFTRSAGRSFENALHIRDGALAQMYADEWVQMYALSEPLRWDVPWISPEFRIGT